MNRNRSIRKKHPETSLSTTVDADSSFQVELLSHKNGADSDFDQRFHHLREHVSKSKIREAAKLNLLTQMQINKTNEHERLSKQIEIVLSFALDETRNLGRHFNEFLSESYDRAARKTQEAITVTKQSSLLEGQLKILDESIEYLKADLIYLEEKSNDYLRYQQFLLDLSPFSWKKDNSLNDDFTSISGSTIHKLYFSAPEDIYKVFQRKTHQSLHLFSKCEQLLSEMNLLNQEIRSIEIEHGRNTDKLLKDISHLKNKIKSEEETCLKSKKIAIGLISGPFHDVVTDANVIKLHVLVENMYESVISKNDTNLSKREMIRELESIFVSLIVELQCYPSEIVQKIENETILREKNAMKEAVQAARKMKETELLMKNLRKAISKNVPTKPIRNCKQKLIVTESVTKKTPSKCLKDTARLTQKEAEFLEYFCNFSGKRCAQYPLEFLENFDRLPE